VNDCHCAVGGPRWTNAGRCESDVVIASSTQAVRCATSHPAEWPGSVVRLLLCFDLSLQRKDGSKHAFLVRSDWLMPILPFETHLLNTFRAGSYQTFNISFWTSRGPGNSVFPHALGRNVRSLGLWLRTSASLSLNTVLQMPGEWSDPEPSRASVWKHSESHVQSRAVREAYRLCQRAALAHASSVGNQFASFLVV
jgi:hypothetical protein